MADITQQLGQMLAGAERVPSPMAPSVPQLNQSADEANAEMPKGEEKPKGLTKDPSVMADFLKSIRTDVDNRRYVDWAWYVYDNYVKGNHFVKYNDITQMVEAVPDGGNQRYALNKVWTTLRSVRGFVTKFDPKWYVFPEDNSTASIDKAHYKQKLLDDAWIFGEMKMKSKQNVFQGLKYSVGILEIGWDSDKKEPTYEVWDPYQVYLGGPVYPNCTRVTKTCWRTHEDIANDPKYTGFLGELDTSDTEYVSELKQQLMSSVYGYQNKSAADKGTIVYECHYLVPKKNSKGGHVNIATFTNSTFLRHVETDYTSLWDVFKFYRTDDNPGENYGEGWVKNLIPPQKMLDILEGLTMEYHHTFAKGRYMVSKNSGARVITNQHGTIIEHNPGRRPVVENAPSMAASVDNQINRINIYLEDIGGQHDASIGRLPTGASAGVAIEALQEGDANNLKDLVENYNTFLVSVAMGTFQMYARRLKTTKIIQTDDKDGDGNPDFFAIIGEKASNIPETIPFNGQDIPVCVIRENEKLRVTVDSWLAYTRDAREQRVYKHYTAGLISRRAALNALNYGDVDKIISEAIKEEVMSKMIQEGPQAPPEQPGPGEVPASNEPIEPDTAGAVSPDAGIPMPL